MLTGQRKGKIGKEGLAQRSRRALPELTASPANKLPLAGHRHVLASPKLVGLYLRVLAGYLGERELPEDNGGQVLEPAAWWFDDSRIDYGVFELDLARLLCSHTLLW